MTVAAINTAEIRAAVEVYQAQGLVLVPIPPGKKGPQGLESVGWNLPEQCIYPGQAFPNGYGVGLAHAYSGTVALDIDDLQQASAWFASKGINLTELLQTPGTVQIVSGMANRAKLLYRMNATDPVLRSKKIKSGTNDIIDFRCATMAGKTVQDVLAPTIHPGTGRPYALHGDIQNIPVIPAELLALWKQLISTDDTKKYTATHNRQQTLISETEIVALLSKLDPDVGRDDWFRIGMAVHAADPGFEHLWEDWSRGGGKFVDGDCERVWGSFTHPDEMQGKGVDVGSLYYYAREADRPSVAEAFTKIEPPPLQDQTPAERAPEAAREHTNWFTLGELRKADPRVKWTIPGRLPANNVGFTYGPSGTFKTFIMLDKALCVATGRPYWGIEVEQGPVFFLAAEGEEGFAGRTQAWCNRHGFEGVAPFFLNDFSLNLSDAEQFAKLIERIDEMIVELGVYPKLIVVDTFSAAAGGVGESDNDEVAQFISNVETHLKFRYKATIEFVHHTGKDKSRGMRGAYALYANAGYAVLIDHEYEDEKPTGRVVVGDGGPEYNKMKNAALPDPMVFQMEDQTVMVDPDTDEVISSKVPVYVSDTLIEKPIVVDEDKQARIGEAVMAVCHDVKLNPGGQDYPGGWQLTLKDVIDEYTRAVSRAVAVGEVKKMPAALTMRRAVEEYIKPKGRLPVLTHGGCLVYRQKPNPSQNAWEVIVEVLKTPGDIWS